MGDEPIMEKHLDVVWMEDINAEVDKGVTDVIQLFNDLGLETIFCCSGFPSDHFDLSDKDQLDEDELDEVKEKATNAYVSVNLNSVYNTENLNDLFYIDRVPTLRDALSGKVPLSYYIIMRFAKYQGSEAEAIGFALSQIGNGFERTLNWEGFVASETHFNMIDDMRSQFIVEEQFPIGELGDNLNELMEDYALRNLEAESFEEYEEGDEEDDPVDIKDVERSGSDENQDTDLESVDLTSLFMDISPYQRLSSVNLSYKSPNITIRHSEEARSNIHNAESVDEIEEIVQTEWNRIVSVLEEHK